MEKQNTDLELNCQLNCRVYLKKKHPELIGICTVTALALTLLASFCVVAPHVLANNNNNLEPFVFQTDQRFSDNGIY